MIRQNEKFLSQVYSVTDFLAIQIAFVFAWWLKFVSGIIPNEAKPLPIQVYFSWSIVYGLVSIGVGYFFVFYSAKRKRNFSYEAFKIVQIHVISLLILLSILFVYKEVHISRTFLLLYLTSNILLITGYRYILKSVLKYFRAKGYNKHFVLILGAGSLGKRFYRNLAQRPEFGYEVVGFLDDNLTEHEGDGSYKPILGSIDELEEILNRILVDEVIIALPLDAHHKFGRIIYECEKAGVKTMIIPDFFDILPAQPSFDNFAGIPLINVRDIPLDELRNRFLKRLFDITFSLAALLVTFPLMIVIALGIKFTSPGPILFKQERVGLHRRKFTMYKFRTMKVMPEGISDTQWTTENDPRRTKFGAFLRKTSLDELPQFFNVLIGDMSVVGPRPERPYFVEQFKEEIPKYMVKHHIRPGLTGWAQSNGLRGDTSIEERIKFDIYYIENWTLYFDIKIILKTIVNGFVNRNAY